MSASLQGFASENQPVNNSFTRVTKRLKVSKSMTAPSFWKSANHWQLHASRHQPISKCLAWVTRVAKLARSSAALETTLTQLEVSSWRAGCFCFWKYLQCLNAGLPKTSYKITSGFVQGGWASQVQLSFAGREVFLHQLLSSIFFFKDSTPSYN